MVIIILLLLFLAALLIIDYVPSKRIKIAKNRIDLFLGSFITKTVHIFLGRRLIKQFSLQSISFPSFRVDKFSVNNVPIGIKIPEFNISFNCFKINLNWEILFHQICAVVMKKPSKYNEAVYDMGRFITFEIEGFQVSSPDIKFAFFLTPSLKKVVVGELNLIKYLQILAMRTILALIEIKFVNMSFSFNMPTHNCEIKGQTSLMRISFAQSKALRNEGFKLLTAINEGALSITDNGSLALRYNCGRAEIYVDYHVLSTMMDVKLTICGTSDLAEVHLIPFLSFYYKYQVEEDNGIELKITHGLKASGKMSMCAQILHDMTVHVFDSSRSETTAICVQLSTSRFELINYQMTRDRRRTQKNKLCVYDHGIENIEETIESFLPMLRDFQESDKVVLTGNMEKTMRGSISRISFSILQLSDAQERFADKNDIASVEGIEALKTLNVKNEDDFIDADLIDVHVKNVDFSRVTNALLDWLIILQDTSNRMPISRLVHVKSNTINMRCQNFSFGVQPAAFYYDVLTTPLTANQQSNENLKLKKSSLLPVIPVDKNRWVIFTIRDMQVHKYAASHSITSHFTVELQLLQVRSVFHTQELEAQYQLSLQTNSSVNNVEEEQHSAHDDISLLTWSFHGFSAGFYIGEKMTFDHVRAEYFTIHAQTSALTSSTVTAGFTASKIDPLIIIREFVASDENLSDKYCFLELKGFDVNWKQCPTQSHDKKQEKIEMNVFMHDTTLNASTAAAIKALTSFNMMRKAADRINKKMEIIKLKGPDLSHLQLKKPVNPLHSNNNKPVVPDTSTSIFVTNVLIVFALNNNSRDVHLKAPARRHEKGELVEDDYCSNECISVVLSDVSYFSHLTTNKIEFALMDMRLSALPTMSFMTITNFNFHKSLQQSAQARADEIESISVQETKIMMDDCTIKLHPLMHTGDLIDNGLLQMNAWKVASTPRKIHDNLLINHIYDCFGSNTMMLSSDDYSVSARQITKTETSKVNDEDTASISDDDSDVIYYSHRNSFSSAVNIPLYHVYSTSNQENFLYSHSSSGNDTTENHPLWRVYSDDDNLLRSQSLASTDKEKDFQRREDETILNFLEELIESSMGKCDSTAEVLGGTNVTVTPSILAVTVSTLKISLDILHEHQYRESLLVVHYDNFSLTIDNSHLHTNEAIEDEIALLDFSEESGESTPQSATNNKSKQSNSASSLGIARFSASNDAIDPIVVRDTFIRYNNVFGGKVDMNIIALRIEIARTSYPILMFTQLKMTGKLFSCTASDPRIPIEQSVVDLCDTVLLPTENMTTLREFHQEQCNNYLSTRNVGGKTRRFSGSNQTKHRRSATNAGIMEQNAKPIISNRVAKSVSFDDLKQQGAGEKSMDSRNRYRFQAAGRGGMSAVVLSSVGKDDSKESLHDADSSSAGPTDETPSRSNLLAQRWHPQLANSQSSSDEAIFVTVSKSIAPSKYYFDLDLNIAKQSVNLYPEVLHYTSSIASSVEVILPPNKEFSPLLPFYDNLRFQFHGNMTYSASKFEAVYHLNDYFKHTLQIKLSMEMFSLFVNSGNLELTCHNMEISVEYSTMLLQRRRRNVVSSATSATRSTNTANSNGTGKSPTLHGAGSNGNRTTSTIVYIPAIVFALRHRLSPLQPMHWDNPSKVTRCYNHHDVYLNPALTNSAETTNQLDERSNEQSDHNKVGQFTGYRIKEQYVDQLNFVNQDRFHHFRTRKMSIDWNIELRIADSKNEPIQLHFRLDTITRVLHGLKQANELTANLSARDTDELTIRYKLPLNKGLVRAPSPLKLQDILASIQLQLVVDRIIVSTWPSHNSLTGVVCQQQILDCQLRVLRPSLIDLILHPAAEKEDPSMKNTNDSANARKKVVMDALEDTSAHPLQIDHLFCDIYFGEIYVADFNMFNSATGNSDGLGRRDSQQTTQGPRTSMHQDSQSQERSRHSSLGMNSTQANNVQEPQTLDELRNLLKPIDKLAHATRVVVSLTENGEVSSKSEDFVQSGILESRESSKANEKVEVPPIATNANQSQRKQSRREFSIGKEWRRISAPMQSATKRSSANSLLHIRKTCSTGNANNSTQEKERNIGGNKRNSRRQSTLLSLDMSLIHTTSSAQSLLSSTASAGPLTRKQSMMRKSLLASAPNTFDNILVARRKSVLSTTKRNSHSNGKPFSESSSAQLRSRRKWDPNLDGYRANLRAFATNHMAFMPPMTCLPASYSNKSNSNLVLNMQRSGLSMQKYQSIDISSVHHRNSATSLQKHHKLQQLFGSVSGNFDDSDNQSVGSNTSNQGSNHAGQDSSPRSSFGNKIWGLKVVDVRILFTIDIRDRIFAYVVRWFGFFDGQNQSNNNATESTDDSAEKKDDNEENSRTSKADNEIALLEDFIAMNKYTPGQPNHTRNRGVSNSSSVQGTPAQSLNRKKIDAIINSKKQDCGQLSIDTSACSSSANASAGNGTEMTTPRSLRDTVYQTGGRGIKREKATHKNLHYVNKNEAHTTNLPSTGKTNNGADVKISTSTTGKTALITNHSTGGINNNLVYFIVELVDPQLNFLDKITHSSLIINCGKASLEGKRSEAAIIPPKRSAAGSIGSIEPKRRQEIRLRMDGVSAYTVPTYNIQQYFNMNHASAADSSESAHATGNYDGEDIVHWKHMQSTAEAIILERGDHPVHRSTSMKMHTTHENNTNISGKSQKTNNGNSNTNSSSSSSTATKKTIITYQHKNKSNQSTMTPESPLLRMAIKDFQIRALYIFWTSITIKEAKTISRLQQSRDDLICTFRLELPDLNIDIYNWQFYIIMNVIKNVLLVPPPQFRANNNADDRDGKRRSKDEDESGNTTENTNIVKLTRDPELLSKYEMKMSNYPLDINNKVSREELKVIIEENLNNNLVKEASNSTNANTIINSSAGNTSAATNNNYVATSRFVEVLIGRMNCKLRASNNTPSSSNLGSAESNEDKMVESGFLGIYVTMTFYDDRRVSTLLEMQRFWAKNINLSTNTNNSAASSKCEKQIVLTSDGKTAAASEHQSSNECNNEYILYPVLHQEDLCVRCGRDTALEKNHATACSYHADDDGIPGQLRYFTVMDELSGQPIYLQAWTCCNNQHAHAVGCKRRPHLCKQVMFCVRAETNNNIQVIDTVTNPQSTSNATASATTNNTTAPQNNQALSNAVNNLVEITVIRTMDVSIFPNIDYDIKLQITRQFADFLHGYFSLESSNDPIEQLLVQQQAVLLASIAAENALGSAATESVEDDSLGVDTQVESGVRSQQSKNILSKLRLKSSKKQEAGAGVRSLSAGRSRALTKSASTDENHSAATNHRSSSTTHPNSTSGRQVSSNTTSTSSAAAAVSGKKQQRQEGLYVRYMRFGDINVDVSTSGFTINLESFQALMEPFLCRGEVLTWRRLIHNLESHVIWSLTKHTIISNASNSITKMSSILTKNSLFSALNNNGIVITSNQASAEAGVGGVTSSVLVIQNQRITIEEHSGNSNININPAAARKLKKKVLDELQQSDPEIATKIKRTLLLGNFQPSNNTLNNNLRRVVKRLSSTGNVMRRNSQSNIALSAEEVQESGTPQREGAIEENNAVENAEEQRAENGIAIEEIYSAEQDDTTNNNMINSNNNSNNDNDTDVGKDSEISPKKQKRRKLASVFSFSTSKTNKHNHSEEIDRDSVSARLSSPSMSPVKQAVFNKQSKDDIALENSSQQPTTPKRKTILSFIYSPKSLQK